MSRLIYIFLSLIMMLFLFTPQSLAPTLDSNPSKGNIEQLLNDIIADYETYTFLLQDVYVYDHYLVSARADNFDSASDLLADGFDQPLAENMAAYFFMHIPELNKLAVIPTESIPVITAADKPYLNVQRVSPDTVVVERVYSDCYETGDRYLYQISAHYRGGRWIIYDLTFNSL